MAYNNYNNQPQLPMVDIGKGGLKKGRKSKDGKTYDLLDGYIIDPITGNQIGIKGFISSTPKVDKTGKPYTDALTGEVSYAINFKLKGIRTKELAAAKPNAKFTPIVTQFAIQPKTHSLANQTVQVTQPVVNETVSFVEEDEMPF